MATAILEDIRRCMELEIRCEMERLVVKNDPAMVMRGQKAMNWIRDALIINEERSADLDYFEFIVPLKRWDDEDNTLKYCFYKFITMSLSSVRECRFRKKMKHIKEEVDHLYDTRPSPSDVELVGFDGYIQRLDGWLREEGDLPHSGLKKIGVIYGPPGSGKTSLAFEVYNSDAVKTHFSSLVWVRTPSLSFYSDDSSYYKLLPWHFVKTTLEQLEVNTVGVEAVCDALKDKRYLIVLDWNVGLNSETHVFEMLRNMGILNVGENGSRIVVTSLKKIDPNGLNRSDCCRLNWGVCCGNVIELQPLSKEDSFIRCSGAVTTSNSHLHSEIVKKCEGLPSAIVNLGFFLSTVKAEASLPQLDIRKIVSMDSNYFRLMYHSKIFFLSFGMFPEGSEIRVKILFQLVKLHGSWRWRDEHEPITDYERTMLPYWFLWCRGDYELMIEYETTEFLRDLQSLGLIEVQWSATRNKAKTCRLKATAMDFCIMKAMQINFFNIIGNRIQRHNFPKVAVQSRLAVHPDYDRDQITAMKPFFPHLRWLFCFSETDPDGWKLLFKRLRSSKLLEVLDLENMKSLKSLPKWIGKLKHLTYLGLRGTCLDSLPSSIVNLRHLHTLDIRKTHIYQIPTSIEKLYSLKHLYMDMDTSVDGDYLNLSGHFYLRTLSMIRAGGWMEDGLRNLEELQKLGIYGDLDLFRSAFVDSPPILTKLESLKLGLGFGVLSKSMMKSTWGFTHLRSLYLERHIEELPDAQDFPPFLTKLHLKWTQLDQDPLPTLEQLPNLKVLKLRCGSYLGKEMVCSQAGFKQLLILELDLLEPLEELRIENPTMLEPKCLVIHLCTRLKMIPNGLQHLHKLKQVEVSEMPVGFNARLQHSLGEDWTKVQHIRSVTIDGIQMAASSSSNPASNF